ncbi:MAG: hypothetical protein JWO91_2375 [Acidobacteriaceae bacterium]|nr:hypothetical protein [Acidobacteriaceae bacterium]
MGITRREDWHNALNRYWEIPSVRKNIKVEKRMDKLDSQSIKKLAPREWYSFLKDEYFPWKYTAPNRLASTTKSLKKYDETNSLNDLSYIKQRIFDFDAIDIQRGLSIAESIKGLGWAGASGLLAVLFPKWFGTADQFVVKTLLNVESLPEKQRLQQVNPKGLKKQDAVLLVDIMRRKANELNDSLGTDEWTPREIDMILWALRSNVSCSPCCN